MVELPFDAPRTPMEAKTAETLPGSTGAREWAYEPKWDGFRMLAWPGSPPRMDSRNRKPLLRYFPELTDAIAAIPSGTVVDGEVVVVRDGQLDFDALGERIHPAERRITELSERTPAELVAFDLLAHDGDDLRDAPFHERRARLTAVLDRLAHPWHVTPSTTDRDTGAGWFDEFESAGCDGIVCKRLDGAYVEGKRAMVKVKHRRDVDCVVGGYRVHKDGHEAGIGSLLLGLYDDAGELAFVGHCSNFSGDERIALLAQLDALADGSDGFGQAARRPGAESRWTAGKDLSWVSVPPELVAEVSYGQLTNGRFRHATRFERWRADKDPEECTFAQLERPEGPDFAAVVADPDR